MLGCESAATALASSRTALALRRYRKDGAGKTLTTTVRSSRVSRARTPPPCRSRPAGTVARSDPGASPRRESFTADSLQSVHDVKLREDARNPVRVGTPVGGHHEALDPGDVRLGRLDLFPKPTLTGLEVHKPDFPRGRT
jgi:hypothetical protein